MSEKSLNTALPYGYILRPKKAYDRTWRYYILTSMKEYGLNGRIFHTIRNVAKTRV